MQTLSTMRSFGSPKIACMFPLQLVRFVHCFPFSTLW